MICSVCARAAAHATVCNQREAAQFVFDEVDPVGIIAAGTIIRYEALPAVCRVAALRLPSWGRSLVDSGSSS